MSVIFGRGSQEYKDAFARKLVPAGAYVRIGKGREKYCPSFKVLKDGNLGFEEIEASPEIVIRDELWRVVVSKMKMPASYEQRGEDQRNGREQLD